MVAVGDTVCGNRLGFPIGRVVWTCWENGECGVRLYGGTVAIFLINTLMVCKPRSHHIIDWSKHGF